LLALLGSACDRGSEIIDHELEIRLEPASPVTTDDLVVTITNEAPSDGAAVTYSYAWFVDGTRVEDATSDTLRASYTARSQTWRVVATPSGAAVGSPAEATVTIGNSGPVLAPTLSPGPITTNTPVTAAANAVDPDQDAFWTTYTWFVDDVEV